MGFPYSNENLMESYSGTPIVSVPWNKGRLLGQKAPLKLKEIWAICIRLQLAGEVRDLAPFDLVNNSKLRGCNSVSLRVCDIAQGKSIFPRNGHAAQDTLSNAVRDY
jgi:hypothetical protein